MCRLCLLRALFFSPFQSGFALPGSVYSHNWSLPYEIAAESFSVNRNCLRSDSAVFFLPHAERI